MRFILSVLFLSVFLNSCSAVYHSSETNQPCEVLLPSIAESYEGYCKDGKAHGLGVASGLHAYEGKFINGYPDGEGTYSWRENRTYVGDWRRGKQNGFGILTYEENGQTMTASGFWYEGELAVVAEENKPYRLLTQRGVVSATVRKDGVDYGNTIKIAIKRNGEDVQNILSDLTIDYSSGTLTNPPGSNFGQDFQITGVSYPMELVVNYKIPNLMNTSLITNNVRLEIIEPGNWLVNLDNN